MMNFLTDRKSIAVDVIQIQSRSMSDPNLSDIDFENKMTLVTFLNRRSSPTSVTNIDEAVIVLRLIFGQDRLLLVTL